MKSSDNMAGGSAAEEQRSKFYENKTLEWNRRESESYDSFMKMNQVSCCSRRYNKCVYVYFGFDLIICFDLSSIVICDSNSIILSNFPLY